MNLTLTDLALYKELTERQANNRHIPILTGSLLPIEDTASSLLEFNRKEFPTYTCHGIQHSLRILSNLEKILSKDFLDNMDSMEIYCLIVAAIFHDSGMVNRDEDTQEETRKQHHLKSKSIVEDFFTSNLQATFPDYDRLSKIINFIIESHMLSLDELRHRDEFNRFQTINSGLIRPNLLCTLLRVGDLLDMSEERSCYQTVKLLPSKFRNKESNEHIQRHLNIETFYLSENQININVISKSKTQHIIWKQWFDYLELEILNANTNIFKDDLSCFKFPSVNLNVDQHKDSMYELWDLKFELDESRKLFDIISKSIYTKKHDHIRELIQNSIDATLRKYYLNNDFKIDFESPRIWNIDHRRNFVIVEYSKSKNSLTTTDSGIGMDDTDLKRFLFKISSSGAKDSQKVREFYFPSIASFGIGFVSALAKSNEIKITTKKENNNAYEIYIKSDSTHAYVEKSAKVDCGTEVEIKLNFQDSFRQISNYIHETFKHTSCPILLIDKDNIVSNYNDLKTLNLVSEDSEFEDLISSSSFGFDQLIKIIDEADSVISSIQNKTEKNIANETLNTFKDSYSAPNFILKPKNKHTPLLYSLITSPDEIYGEPPISIENIDKLPINSSKIHYLWIPHCYVDYDLGIEWEAWIGLLIKDGITTSYIDIDDQFENNDELGNDYSPHEIDFNDKHYARILASDNRRVFVTSKNIMIDEAERRTILDKPPLKSDDFNSQNNLLFQDGIKLSTKVNDLFPFRCFTAELNLTGRARLPLNVSRHSVDENPLLIETWYSEVAINIIDSAMDKIIDIANKLGIDLKQSDIFTNTNSSFSQYTQKRIISEIVKQRKLG